ncbi:MAG: hypothetical protein P4L46_24600 [Fimbriimonas sp.]|nr:hypothetical protein [Fimbriimonas sp.]
MVVSLLVAMHLSKCLAMSDQIFSLDDWEEEPVVQSIPGYHPMLKFMPESSYMLVTPAFIQQGKYQFQNGHYFFRAVTAFEQENADIAKLMGDMSRDAAIQFHKQYEASMLNFEGDYDPNQGKLEITYLVKGTMRIFSLYPYTAGDNHRVNAVDDHDRGMVGVWHTPEPYPDKLDSHWRYRIGGLEGLEQFFTEASRSDSAQFGLIDLRIDRTFRLHAKGGIWNLNGRTLTLIFDTGKAIYNLSDNGQKLLQGGKPVYIRN